MKGKNKTILSIFLSCVMVCISVPVVYAFANTEKQSYNSVVHAGGVLGNSVYLNSQEGFMFYANNGYSIIEIDFLYTSDKEIVGSHLFEHLPGFNLENRPTMKEFESAKLDGRYTGITYDWLIEELKMFPDIKVVFDSKEDDSIAILEDMVETAHQKDFAIESRMIVQVYSIENYNEIKNNPALNFTTFWFTNYKAKYTNFQIQEYFGDKEDIDAIVLHYFDWWFYHQTNFQFSKKVAVHAANGEEAVNFLADRGVDYIYVDKI